MSDPSRVERVVGLRRSWPPLTGPDGEPFDLAAALAHDIRSPLAAIQILAAGLEEGVAGRVNAAQRRQLGVIRSAAVSLGILAADVEDLVRAADSQLDGPPRPFSVRKVFDDVRRILGPLQEVKQIALRLRAPLGETDCRLGHPAALRRILLNLGMNALQATTSGTVLMAARPRGPLQVEFVVTDNGPGFETHSLATGLGLKMCRDLLAALGSALEMRTLTDGGGRVRFLLDLEPASEPADPT